MNTRERHFRRTLRLLPAGYRQLWEEDMVNAYLERDGADASAEHLSLVRLALRLRLAGTHLTPRGRPGAGRCTRSCSSSWATWPPARP